MHVHHQLFWQPKTKCFFFRIQGGGGGVFETPKPPPPPAYVPENQSANSHITFFKIMEDWLVNLVLR